MKAFFAWIASFFKKKQVGQEDNSKSPVPPPIKPNYPTPGIKKIALIVGHGNGDSGAVGWNRMSEFDYNSFVANELVKIGFKDKQLQVFYRGSTGIVGVATKVVAWKPDISIEMHLNAFNGKAAGCEVLCLNGDNESASLARNFTEHFTKAFNRKTRGDLGVKWIGKEDRGYTSLKALSPIAKSILIESFFIDNKEEWVEPLSYLNFFERWIRDLE